jgi:hypothetical protein
MGVLILSKPISDLRKVSADDRNAPLDPEIHRPEWKTEKHCQISMFISLKNVLWSSEFVVLYQ